MSSELKSKLKNIKLIISDVDGILTDGTIFIGSDGTEFKQFTVEDGAGAAFSRLAGIPIALISGRYSKSTEIRANEMKIEKCYQGSLDKLTPFAEICEHYQTSPEEVVYIGDGLIDIPVMEKVAVSVSVPHAHFMVKDLADHITQASGGEGVLREVVEWVLMAQDRHKDVLEKMRETIYKA
jgi:YrbI family 3-deoxy-D-manno-octulosonate 8-phosphate phosphatase